MYEKIFMQFFVRVTREEYYLEKSCNKLSRTVCSHGEGSSYLTNGKS